MFVISTRNFPPEIGGMQNLMSGLSLSLLKHGPVKVFADKANAENNFDKNSEYNFDENSIDNLEEQWNHKMSQSKISIRSVDMNEDNNDSSEDNWDVLSN